MALLALFVGLACDNGGPTDVGPESSPSKLAVVSGNDQVAIAGGPLDSALVVRVENASGQPVRGALVRFKVVSGDGTVSPAAVRTDRSGLARSRWTLGPVAADSQIVEVGVEEESADSALMVRFTATAKPGPARHIEATGGNHQTVPVGVVANLPLQVRVTDQYGNPVPEVSVEWKVAEGVPLDLTSLSTKTDSAGIAETRVRSRSTEGQHQVEARVPELSDVTFVVTVVPASRLTPATIEIGQGDGVEVPAGTSAGFFTVVVKDAEGYPVQNAQVTWSFAQGSAGGKLVPTTSYTTETGVATTLVEYGTHAGPQIIIARVEGVADSVVFRGRSLSGAPVALEKVSGDDQRGVIGTALATPLRVRARDQHGNPVPGVTVGWNVVLGGGTVTTSLSATDSLGIAQNQWTLGTLAGAQSVSASVGSAMVLFSAQGLPDAPSEIEIVSGQGQRFLPGHPLPQRYVIRVRDAHGNAVSGASLAWSVVSGGGTLDSVQAVTGADGTASARHVLGSIIGAQSARVSIQGVADAAVDFDATAFQATLEKQSGDAQRGIIGMPLSDSFVVVVKDDRGQPVAGAPVDWSIGSEQGAISPTRSLTDSQGRSAAVRTMGPKVGVYTATARLGSSSLVFSAQASGPSGEERIEKISGDQQTGIGGQPLSQPYVVRVLDASGTPVQGVTVRWRVAPGSGGAISASANTTDALGQARVTATLPQTLGASQTVVAYVDALEDSVTFTSSVSSTTTPMYLEKVASESGDMQEGVVGQPLVRPFAVMVLSSSRAPVPGVVVTWKVLSGGGVLGNSQNVTATSTTDANGIATMELTLGPTIGAQTVEASVSGLVGSPVVFTAYATSHNRPRFVEVYRGFGQKGIAGDTLLDPLEVQVLDSVRSPVPGVVVSWKVTQGGGQVAAATSITNGKGVATMRYRLGFMPGSGHEVRASVSSVPSPAVFSAYATSAPASIAVDQGDGVIVSPGHVVPTPLRVLVRDYSGEPVRGAKVIWSITGGGGSLSVNGYDWVSQDQVIVTYTDEYGIAQVWRLVTGTTGDARTSALLDRYTEIPAVYFVNPIL